MIRTQRIISKSKFAHPPQPVLHPQSPIILPPFIVGYLADLIYTMFFEKIWKLVLNFFLIYYIIEYREHYTMDQSKIDRINFLAKKSKEEGLTESEKAEQKALREEYLSAIRRNFRATLDSIEIVDKK